MLSILAYYIALGLLIQGIDEVLSLVWAARNTALNELDTEHAAGTVIPWAITALIGIATWPATLAFWAFVAVTPAQWWKGHR